MEADFSGYASKAELKCSDGKTITVDAFKHQDKTQVPLVWQHGHTDVENVLGHAILENRPDGVYAFAFFNKTKKALHALEAVHNKDITQMSIWANQLIQKQGRVLHGVIREVSLVLAGANPGALIENVTIRHSDGDVEELEDEAIIYSGLEFEELVHADAGSGDGNKDNADDRTIGDMFETLNDEQKQLVHFMIGQAVEAAKTGELSQAAADLNEKSTVEEVWNSLTDVQRQLVEVMIGEALDDDAAEHSDTDGKGNDDEMKHHNVFEQGSQDAAAGYSLSHDDMREIVASASKSGSLKEAVEEFALSHGIEDIEILFPEAKALQDTPEIFGRRVEWVANLMSGVRKSPFSRVKTFNADITAAEARAKGYIKGTLKKEEFFTVAKRVTTPQTIYKKQKLDRDDIIDITDFDVVTWMKAEMRIMLDEEIARAILVGDGRAVDDDDKIQETNIRPVATDHELYTTTVTVNIGDASSSFEEVLDAFIRNRRHLRGTGMPTFYTTEAYLAEISLLRDGMDRKLYKNVDEAAADIRVKEMVPVEILEEYPDIVAVIFNPYDYNVGADKGGQVAFFDDFDIDYNQYKYLIETRLSGALVKLKSAMVIMKSASNAVLTVPAAPAFDGSAVTITNQTGVVYRNADTDAVINAAGSPYAVAEGETMNVHAEPASSGYYFSDSTVDDWSFENTGA